MKPQERSVDGVRKVFKFPPEHPEDIGKWIIQERVKAGLTQEQLGKLVMLSQAQVSRLEDSLFLNAPFMQVIEFIKALGWEFEYGEAIRDRNRNQTL